MVSGVNEHNNSVVPEITGRLEDVAQRGDFRKKVALQNQAMISLLSREETVEQYITILFVDNGKPWSSPKVIETLMDVTKFTKTISCILARSDLFAEFVNFFFVEFQNDPRFAILCNILKEIILKICDYESSSFLPRVNDFLIEMPNYTNVYPIMELFTTLVIEQSSFCPYTKQIDELLINKFTSEGSLMCYLRMAEKIIAAASSPRRQNPEILAVFEPETFVRIVCESEKPIFKVNALNILKKLRVSEEEIEEFTPALFDSLTNASGFVLGKIIEFTKTVPSNYISIVVSPQTHCAVKQQIIDNAHRIQCVTREDIIELAERMNLQENKTNPFITDLLEILLQRTEMQGNEWDYLREQVAERKNMREIEYGR